MAQEAQGAAAQQSSSGSFDIHTDPGITPSTPSGEPTGDGGDAISRVPRQEPVEFEDIEALDTTKDNLDDDAHAAAKNDKTKTQQTKQADKETTEEEAEGGDEEGEGEAPGDKKLAAKKDGESEGEEEVKHNADAVRLAKHHGLTEADLEKLTPDQLDMMLVAMDRLLLGRTQQTQQASGANEGGEGGEKPGEKAGGEAKEATLAQKPSTPTIPQYEKFTIPGLEEADEYTSGLLNSINDHYSAKLGEYSEALRAFAQMAEASTRQAEQLSAIVHAQLRERMIDEIESFYETLPKEYKDDFGNGYGGDLDPTSNEFKNRSELQSIAFQLMSADDQSGRQRMSYKQAMNRALKIRYYDKNLDLARKSVASEVEERRKASVQKPTQRRAPVKTGLDIAKANAERLYREKGYFANLDTGELDGFK